MQLTFATCGAADAARAAPEGLTGDELATALHGDASKAGTVRAEVCRLRQALTSAVVGTQPYRLQTHSDADFLTVRAMLAAGRVRDAARAYRGPLHQDGGWQPRDTRILRAFHYV